MGFLSPRPARQTRAVPPNTERRGWRDAWATGELHNDPTESPWTDPVADALQLGVVYGCVSLIATRIATLPVVITTTDGQRLKEGDPGRPLWVDIPDPMNTMMMMTRHDLLSQIVASLLLDGNAYIAIGMESSGRVIEMQTLNPRAVSIIRRPAGAEIQVSGKVPDYPVEMIRNIVLPGQVKGLPPIEAARTLLSVGRGVQLQSANFFKQGAVLAGVISSDGVVSEDQMMSIAQQWQRKHTGAQNAHIPLVLQNAKYQAISVTPEQAQFLATRSFTDRQIAGQIFHVDPSLVGIASEGSSITYQNVGQRNRQLLDDALLPLMLRIEQCFTQLLPPGMCYRFDTAEFLRADTKTRFDGYAVAAGIADKLGQPLLTLDEMRAREGLDPIPPEDEDDDADEPGDTMTKDNPNEPMPDDEETPDDQN